MTSWWNKNVEKRMEDFKSWIEDHNEPSKKYCRKYVADKNYRQIIDCGSGLASEYFGYINDNYSINYTGLDSCKYLIELNANKGINMIEAELNNELPLEDGSYECVYCREVIEHLPYYETAINNMIRIGNKEVIICWFIKPAEVPDDINYWKEEDLYHNKYNLEKLEKFILSNPKVSSISWKDISDKKNVLHIYLK